MISVHRSNHLINPIYAPPFNQTQLAQHSLQLHGRDVTVAILIKYPERLPHVVFLRCVAAVIVTEDGVAERSMEGSEGVEVEVGLTGLEKGGYEGSELGRIGTEAETV